MRVRSRTVSTTAQDRSYLSPFLLLVALYINSAQAYTFIYAGCSTEKYQPNPTPQSSFQSNLNSLFASALSSSSQALYAAFALGNDSSSPPESAIYGLYQCRGDLRLTDCSKCIQSAVTQIGLICPYSYGASLQLDACLLRYEHINFLGTDELSVVYKKCSLKTLGSDLDFLKRRDDVLGQVGSSGLGFFRVTGSQGVEGYGQCLGDLSEGQCGQCLEEAARKIKVLCGASAAGDVFLGKCSIRYWASGYYDFSRGSRGTDDDDVGKTVAIMVGVIAGLAIIIVGLSFCHKALG
uniref:Gnk2-homologous domain-containing protein n=1 Tax=Kalanchoe fedtschenkoi TaxID=63787 RepID=A0A7N0TD39_KALFE